MNRLNYQQMQFRWEDERGHMQRQYTLQWPMAMYGTNDVPSVALTDGGPQLQVPTDTWMEMCATWLRSEGFVVVEKKDVKLYMEQPIELEPLA